MGPTSVANWRRSFSLTYTNGRTTLKSPSLGVQKLYMIMRTVKPVLMATGTCIERPPLYKTICLKQPLIYRGQQIEALR